MLLPVALFLVANNATTGAPTLSGKVAHGDIICSLFGDEWFCRFSRRMLVPRNRENDAVPAVFELALGCGRLHLR